MIVCITCARMNCTCTTCAYRNCNTLACSTVLAGATRVPVCFTHEREYADRYGCEDIHPLVTVTQLAGILALED
jgi:hypothetical protein